MEVFIWPGRNMGAVPIKVMRISSGWTSSLPGSQLAALVSQGCGAMPSNSRPSFQRPMGTPPEATSFMVSSSAKSASELPVKSGVSSGT
jgi:hypothetical protein